ncbi:MAG: ClpXP protease specificity-enhancing factor [Nitrosomonadales bacterium]|jgi:stringent starvation protein B|nr:ClpXP protease specificity-enhancing factor [Nitrosomonadales bacterium]|tara:strand:- start:227 stop:616 length:390 start_codon:yes stop_codon:yes gene_type:complete
MESTKPYLIRAIFDWCVDEGLTPYILAEVNSAVIAPKSHVKNNEIILNIAPSSVAKLLITNEFISFSARFSGINESVIVPIGSVKSIYAAENNEGLYFKASLNKNISKADKEALNPSNKIKKSYLKLVK